MAWIPDRDIDGKILLTFEQFANKKIENGSLFRRAHGSASS